MRVLVVNKFGFVRGGLERVMFDEMAWLRDAGHDVELFATDHPDNLAATYADSFPEYHELGRQGSGSLRAVADMFWNSEANRCMADVLASFRPDVVHCHGIHRHLSPSVLAAARASGAGVVLTAHDYFAICPGNTLLRGGEELCEPRSCGTRQYFAACVHRCVQGSFPRSVLAATELTFQRTLRTYDRWIDAIISPSGFLAERLIEGGFDRKRVRVVPNGVSFAQESPGRSREAFVFAGRLSSEKGADVAVEAAEKAGAHLIVAGDGPLSGVLRRQGGAEFVGHLERQELAAYVRDAVAVVVPSRCLENAPMAILESMASGTPVIASAIGGIPEQVRDGVDGVLVPPGNVAALAGAMRRLTDPEVRGPLGVAARSRVASDFSPQRHTEALVDVYMQAART